MPELKKQVLVYTTETIGEDVHYIYTCAADATPDEIYAAILVIYPDWIRMEIVIDKS